MFELLSCTSIYTGVFPSLDRETLNFPEAETLEKCKDMGTLKVFKLYGCTDNVVLTGFAISLWFDVRKGILTKIMTTTIGSINTFFILYLFFYLPIVVVVTESAKYTRTVFVGVHQWGISISRFNFSFLSFFCFLMRSIL